MAGAAAVVSGASEPCRGGEARSAAPRKTVYLVRHGEAVHNIAEARARAQAADQAAVSGHAKGSKAYEAMVKAARQAILDKPEFLDAPLSKHGWEQCARAGIAMKGLVAGAQRLPMPTAVLVSPLRRTLESAAALFPKHPKVHICELLRERRTGLPCDEGSGFEPGHLQLTFGQNLGPQEGVAAVAEDASALRLRTARLAELLWAVEDETLCIVTHKGYLRELEQGPLGRPWAKEFDTAEVRIFEVTLRGDGGMDASEVHGHAAAAATSPAQTQTGQVQAAPDNEEAAPGLAPLASCGRKYGMKLVDWVMAVWPLECQAGVLLKWMLERSASPERLSKCVP